MDDSRLYESWLEQRDGDAFAELARRHSAVVYDLAARALDDRTAAEDVLQEALLDLALEPSRKPLEVGIAAWLVRFAVCRARNRRSSERSRSKRQQVVGARRPEEVMPDESVELSDELEHVLSRAEPDERVVLAMRYLHGWGYSRIASALSVSEGAARVRVHRALQGVRSRVSTTRSADGPEIVAGLAAVPVLRLDPAQLNGTIQSVLDQARIQLAAPSGVSGTVKASASSRVAALAIKLALVLGVAGATAVALPLANDAIQTSSASGGSVAALAAEWGLTTASPTAGTTDDSAPHAGKPRPGDWHDGALRRLARGEHELDGLGRRVPKAPDVEPAAAEPASPALQPDTTPETQPDPELSERASPTLREACAARCDPVSFDGERTGLLGSSGGSATSVAPTQGAAITEAIATAKPSDTGSSDDPDLARLLRNRASTRIDQLPPDQRAVLAEAAALVESLVADAISAEAGPATGIDKRTVQRAKRRANRGYRKVRRSLRKVPVGGDEELAFKSSTVSRVLALLVDLVLKPDEDFGRARWPDGVDVQLALDEVVEILSEPGVGTVEAADEPAPRLRLPDELAE